MLWEGTYVEWVEIWGRNANKEIVLKDIMGQWKEYTATETIETSLV